MKRQNLFVLSRAEIDGLRKLLRNQKGRTDSKMILKQEYYFQKWKSITQVEQEQGFKQLNSFKLRGWSNLVKDPIKVKGSR